MISIAKVFEISTKTLVSAEKANLEKAKTTKDKTKRQESMNRAMNIRKKILSKPTGNW